MKHLLMVFVLSLTGFDWGKSLEAQPVLSLERPSDPGKSPIVRVRGDVGSRYFLQSTDDLAAGVWEARDVIQLFDGTATWTDPRWEDTRVRLYRTSEIPADGPFSQLAWIPPGVFNMGSPENEPGRDVDEGPSTIVIFEEGFWMGIHEVTQREFTTVMQFSTSWFNGNRTSQGGENYGVDLSRPVENLQWGLAFQYCQKITATARENGRLPEGYVYRLPTAAEWEYACRAGSQTPFHFGQNLRSGMANFDGRREYVPPTSVSWNASGVFVNRTVPVGQYNPNAWGLYDMHGNVLEWCLDWYEADLPGGVVTNPTGPASGTDRVVRGGSWFNFGQFCRSAQRGAVPPITANAAIGFRVVLAPPLD